MADTSTVVDSGADLAAMASPDLFSSSDASSSADTQSSSEVETTETEVETFDTPEALEGDEPTEEVAEETVTEPEPVAAAPPVEELPEGVVRGKDRNGKPGYFLEENRYKNIYGNHQLVQKVSEILGEPATAEALQLRNEAYMAQERLFSDLNSGDPKAQGAVLGYMLDEMTRAREHGEVGVDPSIPLAQTFYDTLKDRSSEGYATLRMRAARDLVGEMFAEAASNGDESLRLSAQHFAKTLAGLPKDVTDLNQVRTAAQRLGIPFYSKEEMPSIARGGNDALSRLQAENARLNSLVNGKSATTQAAQFDTWFAGIAQTVKSGLLDEAIKPALASVEQGWNKFPNDYQDLVVDRLHRKVAEVIRADAGFNERIKLLDGQARRAASAQRRDEIGSAIKQAYVNRAKLAVEAVKRPILEFAAQGLKERASQNHARRESAQTRTVPKGSTGTVPRTLTPNNLVQMKDGIFDAATAMKQARQLLFGG